MVSFMRLTKRPQSPNWFLEVQFKNKKYVRSTKTEHKPTAKKIAEVNYGDNNRNSNQALEKSLKM